MNRRRFLASTLVAAGAQYLAGCEPPDPFGVTVQHATIDMTALAQAIQPQRCEQWCWAASISMIFGYHGHPIAQEKIVVDTYGAVVCLPAQTSYTIGADLSRGYVDDLGRPFGSQVLAAYDPANNIRNLTNAMIVNELENSRPILYANTHHAEVLYSVEYTGSRNAPNIVGARVIDPWPASPRLHPLSVNELYTVEVGGECTFLAAVRVS